VIDWLGIAILWLTASLVVSLVVGRWLAKRDAKGAK